MAKKHIKTATIITLAMALLGAAGTALALSWKASKRDSLIIITSDKVERLEPRIKEVEDSNARQDVAIAVLKAQATYTAEGVKRIEKHLGTTP
jgi:hypothetical protein